METRLEKIARTNDTELHVKSVQFDMIFNDEVACKNAFKVRKSSLLSCSFVVFRPRIDSIFFYLLLLFV